MISLVNNEGNIRRFRSHVQVKKWLAENVGEDTSEYTILTDYVHPAGVFMSSVLHLKACTSCETIMRVELEEDEYAVIVCPQCGCRSVIE